MKYTEDIVLILDSVLDDYYLLWECFEEYKNHTTSQENLLCSFGEALKEAYKNNFFNFFKGEKFNGEEELILEFPLTDSAIQELIKFQMESDIEIRITTSNQGIKFLNEYTKGGSTLPSSP